MYQDVLNQLRITKTQLKVFICAMLAMFIMMSLHYLGVTSPLKSPLPPFLKGVTTFINSNPLEKGGAAHGGGFSASEEAMKKIRPKLQEKKTEFKLKKDTSFQFIPQADAYIPTYNNAAGYIVVDLDSGKVIAEKNADQHLPIASITKIMTAIIALDLAKPSELFTISERAASYPPSKINIIPGENMTLEELLHASLLASANDATEQIRLSIDETYKNEIFIMAMNEKAEFLGMKHTRFTNPQGFDYQDNGSSPEDLALLTSYALKHYPLIADIVKKDVHYLAGNEQHHENTLYNWNGLIGVYPDTIGMKIGNTNAAGFTTTVVTQRDGKRLFAALLGAPGVMERDMWTAQLLDEAYQTICGLEPVNVTEDQLQAKYDSWILE